MNHILLLAQSDPLKSIFGDGVTGAPLSTGDVSSNFTNIFSFAINAVFVVSAVFALVYLMWGAFDFIMSAGDTAKMGTARQKMINALIGIVLLVASLTVWLLITRNVLGIIGGEGSNIEFKIPTIRSLQNAPVSTPTPLPACGGACLPVGQCPRGSVLPGDCGPNKECC